LHLHGWVNMSIQIINHVANPLVNKLLYSIITHCIINYFIRLEIFVVRLGEVCSHVAAILVAVEQCVREGLNAPSVTSETCMWSRINKKVHAIQF